MLDGGIEREMVRSVMRGSWGGAGGGRGGRGFAFDYRERKEETDVV